MSGLRQSVHIPECIRARALYVLARVPPILPGDVSEILNALGLPRRVYHALQARAGLGEAMYLCPQAGPQCP